MSKKTYTDNLNEISKEELFEGLLGYGLFAEKIPPFLTSKVFYNFCLAQNEVFFEKKEKKHIPYDNIRNINIPRVLSIPNPIAYRNQCRVLADNWDKLKKHFYKSTKKHTHKISRIHLRKMNNENALFKMNYKNFSVDGYPEPDLLIGNNYSVEADISNCFPSMYTHSIPWALVGKEYSKSHKNDSYWFNKIDKFTRNLNDAETHGILIGCHSSNLISEIILVKIDEALYKKKYKFIRNIDDYTCYTKTHEDTEKFLIDLSIELKKFKLTLNHKKTKIIKLPLEATEQWIRKLNSYVFPSQGSKLSFNETRGFLDIALELMQKNQNNSAILNYAIKQLSTRELTPNALDYFIKTIHHLVLIYPYLLHLLDKEIFLPFDVTEDIIHDISQNIFTVALEKKLTEAMSYSLYFAIKYNFKITDNLFDKIKESNDTILMLLAYLHDTKFIKSKKYLKQYKTLANSLVDDFDEYWLFVYEVLPENQLTRYWKKMKEAKISFIKEEFRI